MSHTESNVYTAEQARDEASGAIIKVFSTIVKRLTHLPDIFREKVQITVDDFVLEHFLLYHGLVGTSPENERQFKDVLADICSAVQNESKAGLAIALKLPPLSWKDKLSSIFSGFEQPNRQKAVRLLLPAESTQTPSSLEPVYHEDWRVRANAAHILAFFDVKEAAPHISRAIGDTTFDGKPAFCHLAYSLGKLQTPEAKETLIGYLNHEEPWFRVDAAGALTAWQYDSVALPLMKAMLSCHNLNDYMSVAIGRRHRPVDFLSDNRPVMQDGACELIIGIIEASRQTFNLDISVETDIFSCFDPLAKLVKEHPSPVRIAAALSLCRWILANFSQISSALLNAEQDPNTVLPSPHTLQLLVDEMYCDPVTKSLVDYLGENTPAQLDDGQKQREIQHVVELLGELSVYNSAPYLIPLLKTTPPVLDAVIEALGKLKDTSAADPLLVLAHTLVNPIERASYPKHNQPLLEKDPVNAKTYWTILKALGSLPTADSISLLLQATEDHAPDKRQQAFSSLVSAYNQSSNEAYRHEVVEALAKGLRDPSAPVRLASLQGVEATRAVELTEQVLTLVSAKEASIRKQASISLAQLSSAGHAASVQSAVHNRLRREKDEFKRSRLEKLL